MNKPVESGVWGLSTPYAYRNYIIFCVGQEPRKVTAFRSWASHNGIAFKSLKGCYKGQMEDSFIIAASDLTHIRPWIEGQESIMWLFPMAQYGKTPASLLYADGREEKLGHLVATAASEALRCTSWTYDPSTGIHYTCK